MEFMNFIIIYVSKLLKQIFEHWKSNTISSALNSLYYQSSINRLILFLKFY